MMKLKYLLFLLSIFSIVSCQKEDSPKLPEEEQSAYSKGVFIINEGNFGSGNSSVSFLNEESSTTENNIFQNVNASLLGDTAQSMAFSDDLALIVLNVSNKIEIVNRNTFESMATISEHLSNPRYAFVLNDKIFVSNWGDGMDASDDFVAVFSLADFSFIENIDVAEGPEKIIENGNKIYVAHIGGFSFNNIVSVIDSETDAVIKEIEVGDVPTSMVIDDNKLWVLSSGKPAYADEETAGSLSLIDMNTNEVSKSIKFASVSEHPDHLVGFNSMLYYTMGQSIYSFDPSEDSISQTSLFQAEEAAVLYGFSINDNKAYIPSPNSDFTGDGNLYIYNLSDGSLLEQYSTGINPNSVYFNE